MRLTAIEALGRIGSEASSAVHPLVCLLKVSDRKTRLVVTKALLRIAPHVIRNLPTDFGARRPSLPDAPKSKRHAAWQRSVEADMSRRQAEASIRARIAELWELGLFSEERDAECIRQALVANGEPLSAEQVVMPLLDLAAQGKLCRRRNDQGDWLYRSASSEPSVSSEPPA